MIGPLRILRRWRPAANLADELPIVATRLRPIPSDMSVALDAALELASPAGFWAAAVPA